MPVQRRIGVAPYGRAGRAHRAECGPPHTGSQPCRGPPRAPMTRPVRLSFLASAVGMGALALHAAAGGAPNVVVIGTLSLGWGALATTGVVFPSLEMYGRVVFRGPAGTARVALTFDDGPHPVTTRRVLEALASTRHRATFFVLGEKVRRHPDVVREIHAGGHTLGIHGDCHDRLLSFRMPWSVRAEIARATDAVEAATGARPQFFRPPLGHTSLTTVRGARRAGVTLVGWSSRGYDGIRRRSPEAVIKRVSRTLTDGAIVMLHDAAEHDDFEPASVRALPRLVALLDERGLASVGLDTLLGEQPSRDTLHAQQLPEAPTLLPRRSVRGISGWKLLGGAERR
jgi:peptidoglycan/xylan/chitin deacetylase (PgdA/CDA1 family)